MDDTGLITDEETQHCEAFLTANAAAGIHKASHPFNGTPFHHLSEQLAQKPHFKNVTNALTVRRSVVSFSTRRSSFELWGKIGNLEQLLSDFRRLAPHFSFQQLAGEAGVAVNNEYRWTITDPSYIRALNALCQDCRAGSFGDARHMDVRVLRAGPWGGETGELVVEALENHALAGQGSLWLLAHGETTDGRLRVSLDGMEVVRWAWCPEYVVSRKTGQPIRILDWDYLFDRLLQELDGEPAAEQPSPSFVSEVTPATLRKDNRIADALRVHTALLPIIDHSVLQESDAT